MKITCIPKNKLTQYFILDGKKKFVCVCLTMKQTKRLDQSTHIFGLKILVKFVNGHNSLIGFKTVDILNT